VTKSTLLEDPPLDKQTFKRNIILLCFKLALIGGAIYLVLTRTDLDKIKLHLTNIPVPILILCLILMILAQVVSAFRSKYYFAKAGLNLPAHFAVGLYFTGCLYNSFLPGGISGDGYKIYLLGKLSKLRRLVILQTLVSERANGLLFLLLFTYSFLFISKGYQVIPYGFPLLCAAIPVTVIGYIFSTRWLLKERFKTSLGATFYSFTIQGLVVLVAFLIISAIPEVRHHTGAIYYLLSLFLISNTLAVLPISPGGVGIREVAFIYGAPIFGLASEPGIALSITYFSLSTLMALNGLFFWHKLKKLFYHNKGKHS
jgi:glycosyltransferase 2 family protein